MLIRSPETLDGIVLEHTEDPVEDLLVALSVKPKDRRGVKAAIKTLLKDGYLVHEASVLLIRNFEQAQLGLDDEPPSAEVASRPVVSKHPDLSAIRAAAGAKGGKRSAESRQAKPGFACQANEANGQAKLEAKLATRDLVSMAEKMLENRGAHILSLGDVHLWPELQPIFKAFEETWGRKGAPAHGGDPRAKVILQRLAEGIPVERLVLAVRRSKFAPYMVENQTYQTLTTILRDAAQVDKFCELTAAPRKAGTSRAPQPEADSGGWKAPVEKR